MTTQSWNTVITHTNDAQFRAWGSELSAKLLALGLVQTADTGQINWVTVTRPGTNTAAGYEIWRFNDSLQGSAPIFFKLEYGTGNAANTPAVWLTVGTGSNGSGTITGTATTRVQSSVNSTATNTVANYPSYACAVDGFLGVSTKVGAAGTSRGYAGFIICRTCDATGAPTTTGFVVYTSPSTLGTNNPAAIQAIRTASTAVAFTATTAAFASGIVHNVISSVDGSDTQAYLHWMPTPKVLPVVGVCTMVQTEATLGTSFSTALVGSTPRTYISIEISIGQGGPAASNQSICMLYE